MPAAGENPQLIGGIFRRRYQPFGVLDRNDSVFVAMNEET
jgi:hypothetical protein